MQMKVLNIYLLSMFLTFLCQNTSEDTLVKQSEIKIEKEPILTGADRSDQYLPLLKNKTIGLVVNHSAISGEKHLLDILLENDINVKVIFAPEHGFRGEADAGASIRDGKDSKTGIPIISLYGSKKKPLPADLAGIDYLVYDIQDVGARFYTYISTLHYVMEACAELQIPLLVLDRPNPNGHYIDGPVLDSAFKSFVGMHPVPIVHGMTIAEYAQMIKGEAWINAAKDLSLNWVTCSGYDHKSIYALPVKPSPNLPNHRSILLYPSLCLFEGTVVSMGRGTDKQFQIIGHPGVKGKSFSFTPQPNPGAADPPLKGKLCFGDDFSNSSTEKLFNKPGIKLEYLIEYRNLLKDEPIFFLKNNFFDKLAGTDKLRQQILNGEPVEKIRASWKPGLDSFSKTRKKYLLYPDFL
jgi:uncharacterized protein YbbC (DUF1343 family)